MKKGTKIDRAVDDKVKYCIVCGMCWERSLFKSKKHTTGKVEYYSGFPTLGKKRKICDKCKGEGDGEI